MCEEGGGRVAFFAYRDQPDEAIPLCVEIASRRLAHSPDALSGMTVRLLIYKNHMEPHEKGF